MEQFEILSNIKQLKQQIKALPAGSITKKKISGKTYFYHRWTQNKKRHEKYIPNSEVENFKVQIEQRKTLEAKLKELNKLLQEQETITHATTPATSISSNNMAVHISNKQAIAAQNSASELSGISFSTNIITGHTLRAFSASVSSFRKRECFQKLHDFIYGNTRDKVFILYGLRRTGKTTMIRQIIAEMNDKDINACAFIQITSKDTLTNVNNNLKLLQERGIRYVFLDEVTLMDDFIEGAALFSDIFAACGMKIVLSGTDSLGFLFSEDEQLYDRCILLHTTFIPYREFEYVLGMHSIDEYIRYGGTMSLSGTHYNETSPFATEKSTDEYINTAIAHNIQHSLRCYQHEGHFRHLQDLYEKNELTSAINRVVEDINHRFTLEVLTKEWNSHDLGISANNLRHDQENPTDILDRIDMQTVTNALRMRLEIKNSTEQTVNLNVTHAVEIKEYLDLLDLTQEIDVLHLPDVNTKSSRTVITQPGLRYAQAEALIQTLLLDEAFSAQSLQERNRVQKRILNEIKGRMLEDIVLLETKLANPDKQVFVLQFPIGEFDMVVFNPREGNCQIFEIKHSSQAVQQQYRHLADAKKCEQTEHRYGPITQKTVLYRGENQKKREVCYRNVEEYLRTLKTQLL
jgi:hypothetical protein